MEETKQKPACIGFIMDGNRRWAKKNGKKCAEGHYEGYKKLKEILGWVKEAGVNEAIVYAFSTENWKRTEEEVGALMKLLTFALSNEIESLVRQGVCLKFIGDLSLFSDSFQEMIKKSEAKTASNGPLTLTIALSYGGRAEILQAVKKAALLSKEEILTLNEESLKDYLWTAKTADPDLIIRTGGEVRLSNFLPYQSVYSELFFLKTLWPDFTKKEFENILKEFCERKRNCGK
jgi:undecaprenyl diphosphate synthase